MVVTSVKNNQIYDRKSDKNLKQGREIKKEHRLGEENEYVRKGL